jgi:hypothetical protein
MIMVTCNNKSKEIAGNPLFPGKEPDLKTFHHSYSFCCSLDLLFPPTTMVNRASNMSPNKSLAGTWGEERLRKLGKHIDTSEIKQRYSTVAQTSFSLEPFLKTRNGNPSKYNKFVSIFLMLSFISRFIASLALSTSLLF